jgi:hypothetical protein
MARKPKRKTAPHRGRLQAQGPDTEESVTWNMDRPLTKLEMLAMLDQLWAKLAGRKQEDRNECLESARNYIQQASADGFVAEFAKTFRNRKLRRGVRIDIEIWAGRACIDDPAVS